MTIRTITVSTLKSLKNSVIGNPSAKIALAGDEAFVRLLVDCLNAPDAYTEPGASQDAVRIEAAHIISSIAYGSEEALGSLLRANAHQAFLYALSNFSSADSTGSKSTFVRGLRVLAVALADVVGPSQWGLKRDTCSVRHEAKFALEYLFKLDVLDVYLPLLADPSPNINMSISLMLASTLCTQVYRTVVTEWIPPADRHREPKGKRGWEKPSLINPQIKQSGGWVAKRLSSLLHSKDCKVQEAALAALGALAQDNSIVAFTLAKPLADREPALASTLQTVLSLCKSRITDVQLAACLCATFIIRSSVPNNHHSTSPDQNAPLTVLHILNRLIAADTASTQTRTKACFTLYYFIRDDKELSTFAHERGSLAKLAHLMESMTPAEKITDWDDEESETVSSLREAALTTIAALSLWNDDIRREVTDNIHLVAIIRASLSHSHVGVRYAACQCVRALSRLVAVVRTSLLDSGLGIKVYRVFLKEDEDRRVTFAASSVICNLVNDFSPLRTVMLEQGLVSRLVHLLDSEDLGLRLNALWAFKNLLHKSPSDLKRAVMECIGWGNLANLLADPDPGLQEQAFHIVRHLAETEDDIDVIFQEFGSENLLNYLAPALETDNVDILLQATYLLANLSNGSPQRQISIITNRRILVSLRSCLVDSNVDVRRPASSCVLQLAKNPRSHKELRDMGIDSTLRHMCEYSGGMMSGSPGPLGHQMGVEDDVSVKDRALQALKLLDRNDFSV